MRFIHTADWHIGRKLNGIDLLDDQRNIFEQLLKTVKDEDVQGIVIAGDLYDRALPSEESVDTVNRMLSMLNRELRLPLLVISGNHDSATRLSTGRQWYLSTLFYLNTKLSEAFEPVVIDDAQFFLLPFFELSEARQFFDDVKIKSVNQAMTQIIAKMKQCFDPDKKHILVGHFFAAGSSHSDSETLVNVGGLDAVNVNDLEIFDYVALGHLHNRHAIKNNKVQYAGSLLKFSVSETNQEKGVYIVDTKQMDRKFIPLIPNRDLIHLTDSFDNLMNPEFYQKIKRDQYIAITLTDQDIIVDSMAQLRSIYPNIISLDRTQQVKLAKIPNRQTSKLDPLTLLNQYFENVTGHVLSEQQNDWASEALNLVKEENNATN